MRKPVRKSYDPRNGTRQTPESGLWRFRNVWIYAALFLATFAVYSQVRTFDFVEYDDPDYSGSPHARNGITRDGLVWALTSGEASNWFPVTRLSHLLDCQLFGASSGWHHLTNLLFHALSALLLFAFLHRSTGAPWRSAFAALLFAIHPLHVESVAWVAERKDVLSAFFWFLTLWVYVRYVERPKVTRYLLVLLVFCLGLMSKPMIVTLPFVLLLMDIWPLRRVAFARAAAVPVRWIRVVGEKVPLLVLSAAVAAIAYLTQKSAGSVEMLHVSFPLRLENALVSYAVYILKMFWPSSLAVLYPYPPFVPWWQFAFAGLAIASLSILALRGLRTAPYLAAGWLWYLGTLVPVIGLVQIGLQSRADRYTYIPLVGLSIMLAWSAADVVQRWPKARGTIVWGLAGACLLTASLTWIQLPNWKNSESLYRRAIAVTENNYTMHYGLGVVLAKTPGRLPEAISQYEAAVRIKPDYLEARSNLATALLDTPGRLGDAIAQYEAALRIKPDSAEVHNNLGSALARTPDRRFEAVAHYEAALRSRPEFLEAQLNLANALAEVPARRVEAIAHYQAALRIKPDSLSTHDRLAGVYLEIPGHLADAIAEYEAALRIQPNSAELHNNLGAALAREPARIPEAIAQYQAALRIKPDFREATYNLSLIQKNGDRALKP